MNLNSLHSPDKKISAKTLGSKLENKVLSIQILKGGLLDEHISKVPAVLICVEGSVEYEDEDENKISLSSGDIHEIEAMIKHKVKGIEDSQLLLIK